MSKIMKVWGEANGTQVIFNHVSGGRWETTVPWTDDGEYIVEVFAEDEAGNVGYLCSMLFVISGHELRGYIVPRGFMSENYSVNGYSGFQTIGEYLSELQENGFNQTTYRKEYHTYPEEGGYKIERIVCERYIKH